MSHTCRLAGTVTVRALRQPERCEAQLQIVAVLNPIWDDDEADAAQTEVRFRFDAGEEEEVKAFLHSALRERGAHAWYWCEDCGRLVVVFSDGEAVISPGDRKARFEAVSQGMARGIARPDLHFRTWDEADR